MIDCLDQIEVIRAREITMLRLSWRVDLVFLSTPLRTRY